MAGGTGRWRARGWGTGIADRCPPPGRRAPAWCPGGGPVNPVLRADLRYRLGSSKALTLHTLFLVIIALLTFLSLPPDLARLDELRQGGLVLASLIVSAVLTMYFTSACAAGEIGIDGEKSVWDLAASSFPAETIRSEEHTSELQSRQYLVCRLLLEKKKKNNNYNTVHTDIRTINI